MRVQKLFFFVSFCVWDSSYKRAKGYLPPSDLCKTFLFKIVAREKGSRYCFLTVLFLSVKKIHGKYSILPFLEEKRQKMRYVVGEMTTRPRPGAPESPITQKGDRPDSGRKKEKRSDPMEMENPAKAQT